MVPFSLDWYGPQDSLDRNVLLGMDDMAIQYMQTVTGMLPGWLEQKRMLLTVVFHWHILV